MPYNLCTETAYLNNLVINESEQKWTHTLCYDEVAHDENHSVATVYVVSTECVLPINRETKTHHQLPCSL
jgi:hypothetical protein